MKKYAKNSTIKKLKWVTLIALVLGSFTLFACGGDSDDDGPTETAPTATNGTLTLDEDTPTTGTLSATDPDGDALTYSIVENGTLGTATIMDAATGTYTYTPNQDANGSDSFTFKVNDGAEDSNVATVAVTINPVNDIPDADAGSDQAVDEQTVVSLSGTGTDTEDGDNVTYAWAQTEDPAVILTGADTATPSFIGPAVAASTTLTFSLTVTDTEGEESAADEVIVTVNNAGNLSGSVTAAPDIVDLTAEGKLDWSHWGLVDENSFNQKEADLNLIGDYSDIGEITATRFTNNPTALSWTEGTPTSKVTNSTTGLYFSTGAANPLEESDGIRLTVPADSAEKTLKIYLGVTSARSKLTATLSDGSAVPVEVFVENPLAMAKSSVVTLNFGAAADGETITIDYTLVEDIGADAGGAINLSAATLTEATAAMPTITPDGGMYTNSVTVALATVTPGATIRYTTDGDNPTQSSDVYTGPFNLAVSATVRARAFLPGFNDSVIATADFTINPNNGGSLSACVEAGPDTVNLTAEGGLDWSHWGHTVTNMFNWNAAGLDLVGDYEVIGDKTSVRFENNPTAFSWTGGTPDATATNSTTGIYFLTATQGDGIRLTVPADSTEKTLKIYLGVTSIRARLTATLSDDSAQPVEVFVENSVIVTKSREVTLNFCATADDATLTVEYTVSEDIGIDDGGAINLSAATLN